MGLLARLINNISNRDSIELHSGERQRVPEHSNDSVFNGYTSTDESEIGDIASFSNRENDNTENTDDNIRKIKKEHNIRTRDLIFFRLRNKGIKSKLKRMYDLTRESDIDEYREKASKYFESQLGDTSKMTTQELEEKYSEIEKEFYIQMIKCRHSDKITNAIISSAIAGLKAGNRLKAAQDYLKLSSNEKDLHLRAKNLADDAEYNLTNVDKFGDTPDNDATEYHNLTFSNMDEDGINSTLELMSRRADELNGQYKNNKIYENYIKKGFAGSLTGIGANKYISDEFAKKGFEFINNTINTLGISNEVLDEANKFLQEHPEVAGDINKNHNTYFNDLMELVKTQYSNQTLSGGGYIGSSCAPGYNNTYKKTKGYVKTGFGSAKTQSSENNDTKSETKTDKNNKTEKTGDVSDEQQSSVERKENENNRTSHNEKGSTNPITTDSKSDDNKPEESDSLNYIFKNGNLNDVEVYRKENNISTTKFITTALNDKNTNSTINSLAENLFATKFSTESAKKAAFNNSLNGTGQEKVLDTLPQTVNYSGYKFNSIYVKNRAEAKLKEKENNNCPYSENPFISECNA